MEAFYRLGKSGQSAVAGLAATIPELRYPGFEMTSWYGVRLPAKTPPAIVNKLNAAIVEALKNSDVIEQMQRQGMDTIGNHSAEFSAYLKTETETWAKVVKTAGIKPD